MNKFKTLIYVIIFFQLYLSKVIWAQNFTTDVSITSDSGAEVNLTNTSTNKTWQIVSGFNSGFEIGNVSDGLTDGTSPFYINTVGKVGIGTTNPIGKLSVIGSGTIGNGNFNNAYLYVDDGVKELGIDPNQIYSSDELILSSGVAHVLIQTGGGK